MYDITQQRKWIHTLVRGISRVKNNFYFDMQNKLKKRDVDKNTSSIPAHVQYDTQDSTRRRRRRRRGHQSSSHIKIQSSHCTFCFLLFPFASISSTYTIHTLNNNPQTLNSTYHDAHYTHACCFTLHHCVCHCFEIGDYNSCICICIDCIVFAFESSFVSWTP